MYKKESNNFLKSSFWVINSFAVERVSQLVAQIFLARILSPEDFGIWGMVLIVTRLSMQFRDRATASVLVQRGLENTKVVNAVFSLTINISILMFLLQVLAGFPLSQFFSEPKLLPLTACAALVFLVGAGAGSHGAVLQRKMKFRELAISEGLAGIARFSSILICAIAGFGIWSFAISEVAMAATDAMCKRWFSKYTFKYFAFPDSIAVKEVKGYIANIVGSNLAVYTNSNSDNFIIGKLLGATALGYYNFAYQLAMLPLFALSKINQINFSVLSQKNDEEKQLHLSKALETYAIIYALLYGIGFIVSPFIIPLVYGKEWIPAVVLFKIILIYAYGRGLMYILGTTLNSLNKPQINAAINWALVPFSIPTFFIGYRLGGLTGIAIAVSLSLGLGGSIWFWLATCRATGWESISLIRPIIAPTVSIIMSVLVLNYLPLNNYLLLLQPLLVIFTYSIILNIFYKGKLFIKLKRVFQSKKNRRSDSKK